MALSDIRTNPVTGAVSWRAITAEAHTVIELVDRIPGIYGFQLEDRPQAGSIAFTPSRTIINSGTPNFGEVYVSVDYGLCIFNIADDSIAFTVDYNGGGSVITKDLLGGGGGASAFTDLTDTPASYTGQAGKSATVNDAETGLEFKPSKSVKQYLVNQQAQIDQWNESSSTDKNTVVISLPIADNLFMIPHAGQTCESWRDDTSPPTDLNSYVRVETTVASAPIVDVSVATWVISGRELAEIHANGGTLKTKFKCNLTGKYSLLATNSFGAPSRVNLQSFDYLVADTWQEVTYKFDAETTSAGWNFSDGLGVALAIVLNIDPALSGATSSSAWAAFAGQFSVTGQAEVWGETVGDYFELTGWSLLDGDDDTYVIDDLLFYDDLKKCQKVCQKSYQVGDKVGFVGSTKGYLVQASNGHAMYYNVVLNERLVDGNGNAGIYSPDSGDKFKAYDITSLGDVTGDANDFSQTNISMRVSTVADGNIFQAHYAIFAPTIF
jgi:hypothetical protein